MKKNTSLYIIVMALMCIMLFSCGESNSPVDVWGNAVYTEDTELGEGAKTVEVQVIAEDKSVTFKINTDRETLGDVLIDHELISGEQGAYGLYIKVVNGITADYDIDKSYWSLSKNGEYMTTGVDGTKISGGEHFEITYTK